ncbi:hypothetical protein [Nostoc sp. LEGE 12450]|uniref:hypothetical protein n=1 Tax=Nostoc sp. LEGE 12450 TaxID=1828643 RepID=UPI0018829556|nr:hypothetical protein [Nostoc sp. LEGE 12450]MBE8986962.1 hypothetical protein [Nostoc sp. LEGE 12450]
MLLHTLYILNLLKYTLIKVNAADPGFTATDINQYQGYRTVEQGAIATGNGFSGGLFDENGVLPW